MRLENTRQSILEAQTFISNEGDNKELEDTFVGAVKSNGGISIDTLEGNMLAHLGDYIIKGVAGEFYPCEYNIFHKTYEIVEG
ncbi:hypothetical protein [Tetragenococcus halophilus]|uniref:hypothetical protein n=1 Tax=Tetragenococcus halophilus TaxID=51669 RepID=UPI0030E80560